MLCKQMTCSCCTVAFLTFLGLCTHRRDRCFLWFSSLCIAATSRPSSSPSYVLVYVHVCIFMRTLVHTRIPDLLGIRTYIYILYVHIQNLDASTQMYVYLYINRMRDIKMYRQIYIYIYLYLTIQFDIPHSALLPPQDMGLTP